MAWRQPYDGISGELVLIINISTWFVRALRATLLHIKLVKSEHFICATLLHIETTVVFCI